MSCGVLITSCASYADHALPRLLGSLAAAGVPPDRVRVVIGDCEADRDGKSDGVWVHERRYAMLDNNGLAWACLEDGLAGWPGVDWVVYLHDTCAVDADFWGTCARLAARDLREADCGRLVRHNSMGMGLYRAAWLRSPAVVARLAELETRDAGARLRLKQRLDVLEDTLFKLADQGGGRVVTLAHGFRCDGRAERVYGPQCSARLAEHYSPPGILKFKANWGQGAALKVDL